MSMSPTAVAEILTAAEYLRSIEFYVSQYENKPPELRCRIFGLPGLTKGEMEALATDLNGAVKPIAEQLSQSLLNRAANQLREHL